MITAVVLAAGESQRMNSPKALLPIDSETFAECIARKIRASGIDRICVVVGAHLKEIRSALEETDTLRIISNPRYREGQLASLQEGLKHLPQETIAVLVWPVDQPLVKEQTVRQLLDAFQMQRGKITIPSYSGRKGHPVIYDRSTVDTLLSFGSAQTAKDLQAFYKAETTIVQVDDEAILIDIDTPEDYARYVKRADL